jgi:hypothetical protein
MNLKIWEENKTMSKFINIISLMLGVPGGVSVYDPTSVNTHPKANTPESKNKPNIKNFSAILLQLNTSIKMSMIKSNLSSYGYADSTFGMDNQKQRLLTPDVNSIIQKIKNNKNNSLDIETQIRDYLLENYGGNPATVIMNMTGMQNLPQQLIDQAFNQIVLNVSAQVRQDIYTSKKIESLSLYYKDGSEDTNSASNSSVENFDY